MTTRLDQGGTTSFPERSAVDTTSGWVTFGAIMLLVIGAVNVIQGITALQYDDYLANQLIFDNLTFWGWAFIAWGALQAVAGGMTLAGRETGVTLGITLASVSAVVWFFMIFAAPAAAVVGIGVSVAIVASLSRAY